MIKKLQKEILIYKFINNKDYIFTSIYFLIISFFLNFFINLKITL